MKIGKIFILCIFILSSSCISATATDEEFPKIGFVKNNEANIRAGDNINFEILYKFKKGDPVKIIGKRYSWFKILLPKTAYLYIKNDYIDLDNGKGETGTVNAMHVNLRAGPDTKYSIVGQASKPEKVNIISEENGWYKIEPPVGAVGWIHSNLIIFDLGLTDLSTAKEVNAGAVKAGAVKKKGKANVILKAGAAEQKGNLIFSTQHNR